MISRAQLQANLRQTFDMPRVKPHEYGITVDCSDDPYNVMPVASTIFANVLAQSQDATPDKPFIVTIGETHILPVDRLAIQATLTMLHAHFGKSIAFGYELSHDWVRMADDEDLYIKVPMPKDVPARIADPDGRTSLTNAIACKAFMTAALSQENLFQAVLELGISARFNDASMVHATDCINYGDAHTRDIIAKSALGLSATPPMASSPRGVAERNVVIAESALTHAKEVGARIYVQHCGGRHIFRQQTLGMPFKQHAGEGLSGLFAAKGLQTLNVMLLSRYDAAVVSPSELPAVRRSIAVTGLHDMWEFETSTVYETCRTSGLKCYAPEPSFF